MKFVINSIVMDSGKKALKALNFIVVFFILATLLLAANFFFKSEIGLGATFGGMFIAFVFLYWRYGLSFFEVSNPKADNS